MRYATVCSGIEAPSVAWRALGWSPAFFSEVDPFPCAVLAHHYPHVPNLGDMTRFKEWPDAAFDVSCGGTPCQSFSVAGLRKGLDDPRGNLMLTYLAIAARYRPRWLVWENVPGVLSSGGGRDFGTFLGGLGHLGYGFAYRVLDAQYFGVPQRRRRVFVVGCLADWRAAAAVLFERHSLQGHPAPSREAGKRPAPTISARTKGGGGLGTDFDCDGGLVMAPEIARCIATREGTSQDYETTAMVAHSLRGEAPFAFQTRGADLDINGVISGTIGTNSGQASGSAPMIAFSAKDDGADAGDVSPTLRAGGHTNSHANGGCMPAIAFRSDAGRSGDALTPSADGEGRVRLRNPGFNVYEELAPTLDAGSPHGVGHAMRVRRLMPIECERLQGFPDDYTQVPYRSKPASDGPRYKALGNSMAVPVIRWLGERLSKVDTLS